jgi:hypothetical protein
MSHPTAAPGSTDPSNPYASGPYQPAPAYQMSNPYQPYVPPPKPGTNGFAITSLIFGIIGGVVLSVIFGIVALVQIKNRPQAGKGLAIAGLALSGAWVGVIALIIIVAIASGAGSSPSRDPQGNLASDGKVSVEDLREGDCVNGLKESRFLTRVDGVPCTTPHQSEVFSVFNLPDGDYPGEDEVLKKAEDGCADRFEDYAPNAKDEDLEDLELFYLYPIRSAWSRGDREVTCLAHDPAGGRVGSLRG